MFLNQRRLLQYVSVAVIATPGCSSISQANKPTVTELPVRKISHLKPGLRSRLNLGATDKRISERDYNALTSDGLYQWPEAGMIEWRGDLNSDGVEDYLVETGLSGSAGLEYMLLASRADGMHENVMQTYAQGYRFADDPASKWKTLIIENYANNVTQQCPESSNGPKMITYSEYYKYIGGLYQKVRSQKEIPNPPCL